MSLSLADLEPGGAGGLGARSAIRHPEGRAGRETGWGAPKDLALATAMTSAIGSARIPVIISPIRNNT